MTLFACSSEPAGGEPPTGEEPSSGPSQPSSPASTAPSLPAACTLVDDASNAEVTLTGRLCGETVSVTTRAGAVIHLGRSQATDPETEIRVVEVSDELDPSAPAELSTAQLLVNLAFETGPEVNNGESEHDLTSGVFSLCGFGTVVLASGTTTFGITGVSPGARSGEMELTLGGLLVAGFSPQHGQTKVNACGGELDLTLRGPFVHQ